MQIAIGYRQSATGRDKKRRRTSRLDLSAQQREVYERHPSTAICRWPIADGRSLRSEHGEIHYLVAALTPGIMNDRWIRLFIPAVLILMALYSGQTLVPPYTAAKLIYAAYAATCFIIGLEVSRFIIFSVRKRFPHLNETRKRLKIALVFVLAAVFFFKIVVFLAFQPFRGVPFSTEVIIGSMLETILIALLSLGLYEALYFYSRYLRAEKEKEQLLRSNLQSQLDSLRTQVNPHFLFNSLNSLTALISKDCERAEQFVEEMSGVYRYLLRNNIEDLTTLEQELGFIRSYLHMLETRFGKGLRYSIEVDGKMSLYKLPPLTLQMLVENAIKHNIISSTAPLSINISTDNDDRLTVRNNLQKKYRRVASGKIGLSNIISKYRLLNAPDIEIEENEKEFLVTIPLIRNYELENSYR